MGLIDHHGQVIERYRYSVFGESEVLSPEGAKLTASKVANPWQYANKRLDEETGLVAFGLRCYDPSLGRWITPDPAGYVDGSNLYAYVHNSPLLYWDRFGLFGNHLGFNAIYGSRRLDKAYDITAGVVGRICDIKHAVLGNKGDRVKYDYQTEDRMQKNF